MLRCFAFLLLLASGSWALADETVRICYGYGCLVEVDVHIDETRVQQLGGLLGFAVDAPGERQMLSLLVGRFYEWAGEETPVHNDRGGNYADEGVSGAMDCIDHSTSTTRFLRMIERRGLLRWHTVLEPQLRSTLYIFEHYSAAIEEKQFVPDEEPARFVVDSWFVDNGEPAVILPLEDWKNGAGPNV